MMLINTGAALGVCGVGGGGSSLVMGDRKLAGAILAYCHVVIQGGSNLGDQQLVKNLKAKLLPSSEHGRDSC